MTLHRLNHALAFVFGGYQDYEKFYTPSLLDEDGGLFVAILEQLSETTNNLKRKKKIITSVNAVAHIAAGGVNASNVTRPFSDEDKNDTEEGTHDCLPTEDTEEPLEELGTQTSALTTENTEADGVDEAEVEAANDEEVVGIVQNSTFETEDTATSDLNETLVEQEQPFSIRGSVRIRGDEVNSVRLAQAHAAVKNLQHHPYNIFEAAFFYGPDGDRLEYILNGFQVLVTYLGIGYLFYFLGVEIRRTYEDRDAWVKDDEGNDKEWTGILAINMIGSGYFFFLLGRDVERVILFNRCMMKLCPLNDKRTPRAVRLHRSWALINNFLVNVWFGYLLFVMNFFFVQAVDDFVEAILNAIAVVFIIQIDDIIPPYIRDPRTVHFLSIACLPVRVNYWLDWENKRMHNKLMSVVESFISRPDVPSEHVSVRKTSGHSVVFREPDVCYFFVNRNQSVIRIFCGRMRKNAGKYLHLFEEVTYEVSGAGASIFLDNMAGFECVEEEEESRKLELHNGRHVKRSAGVSSNSP